MDDPSNAAGAAPASRIRTRILILGGGFGGITTARQLERLLGSDASVEITLISRENFFLFTPMLHEVAASDVDITHIVNPIRKVLRHTNLFVGEVESIDLDARRIVASHGLSRHQHEFQYDHLVLGLGAVTSFHGIPDLQAHALQMKSLADAIVLRNRLIENLEEADADCAADRRTTALTLVVAGGGFAGVETVAAANDFLRDSLPSYPHLSEEDLRVVLVHDGAVLLPELDEALGSYTETKLADYKVEVRTGVRVAGVSRTGVRLDDGMNIPTNTLVWTAGSAANPLIQTLPCKLERGHVMVTEYLEVPDWPNLWAVGDCASIRDPRTGNLYPPTAQHAMREGRVLARNIVASLRGGKKQPFVFTTIGTLASLGRRTGVARIFGTNFSGFPAWLLWRAIYLSKLPRFEKKLRVALDWLLDIVFSKDLVQFRAEIGPSAAYADDESAPGETEAPARTSAAGDRQADDAPLGRDREIASSDKLR